MNGSAPFPDDALERSIREYYRRREAPSVPFERSWAALKTALDAEPDEDKRQAASMWLWMWLATMRTMRSSWKIPWRTPCPETRTTAQ